MTVRVVDRSQAALLEEIVRLQTRVAQLEAAALVDRAPPEAAPDAWVGDSQEPLDQAAHPQLLRRDQLFQATAIGVSSATGAAFFRLLSRHLANTLQCDCAVVGVLPPGQTGRVRTLAFFTEHDWLPNFEYDLSGTPCELVVSNGLCLFPSNVQRRFPRDQWLTDWRIESYAGTPLIDSRGKVLGLISVLAREPMLDPEAVRSALRIFATRAAAEVERQQTEESLRASQAALAESEERFRQMAEANRDVFWLFDWPAQKLLYVSPAFEAIWGQSPDWIYEQPFRWLEVVHEDDRGRASAMPMPPPGPGKIFDEVYRIRRSDGSLAWLHDRRYAVCDAAGRCQRLVGNSEDITERHEADEKVRQQTAHLAHVARLSTVGELVASISHEVNQPLYAIANFSAAISEALARPEPPLAAIREFSSEIGKAVVRAGEIIRRVRSYVSRGPQERLPIDLAAIVQESAALLAAEARRHGVHVELDVAPLPKPPMADGLAVQQVLVNLLRNAIEAMVQSSDGRRNVVVVTRQAEQCVEITVSDTGCGLSDEDEHHLFTPFYTSKPEGLGMGLPISKTIVEAHGGRIWAKCNAGGGTTVGFSLPISAPKG